MTRETAGGAGRRRRAFLSRPDRCAGARLRRGEAPARLLRNARVARHARASRTPARTRARRGCSSSRTRSAGTSARPRAPTRPRTSSRGTAARPVADAITVNPYLGRESVEPFLADVKRYGAGLFVLAKTSNAGSADVQDLRLLGRRGRLAERRAARPRVGRGSRRRPRPLERRARDRRDVSARGRRGQAALPAAGLPPPGHRRPGCRSRRRRPRLHERTCQRACRRVALHRLCVPRPRRRLAHCGSPRSDAPARRDLGRLRLVVPVVLRRFFLVVLAALACSAPAVAAGPPAVNARNYLVVNGKTGEVVAARGAHRRVPIASITKLMTVLVALEHAKLSDEVTVRPVAAGVGESSIGLRAGERLTVGDLVEAALIQSANDAAYALAAHVGGGDVGAFVREMNAKARKLRLRDSHFVRPGRARCAGRVLQRCRRITARAYRDARPGDPQGRPPAQRDDRRRPHAAHVERSSRRVPRSVRRQDGPHGRSRLVRGGGRTRPRLHDLRDDPRQPLARRAERRARRAPQVGPLPVPSEERDRDRTARTRSPRPATAWRLYGSSPRRRRDRP